MARKRAASPPRRGIVAEGTFGPPEAPAERASRLRREEAATHQRFKERVILTATLAVTGVGLAASVAVLVLSNRSDAQSRAMAMITSIATAYLGYWGGMQSEGKGA